MTAFSLGFGWLCGGLSVLYLDWPWALVFAAVRCCQYEVETPQTNPGDG